MLAFALSTYDAALAWQKTEEGYARGASWIAPLRHPALETICLARGSRLLLCVRERWRGGGDGSALDGVADLDAAAMQLRKWPLQWLMMIVDGASAKIETGHWGTAPLFLVEQARCLQGHWDAGQLQRLVPVAVDAAGAARWIVDYATPYATRTLYPQLRLLPERGKARWNGQAEDDQPRLTFLAPPPWPRPYAGTLRADVDPVEILESILHASVRRWLEIAGASAACEVSGGLDSCMVAALAHRCEGFSQRSYGLALVGTREAEGDQRARRAEIARQLRLADTAIPMADHLPLAPGSARVTGDLPALPWEEGYYEAMDALLLQAQRDGIGVLATGFGGDELFGLRPSERRALGLRPDGNVSRGEDVYAPAFLTAMAREALRRPTESMPRAAASDSAIEASAFSAARYLRRGIWPVHPLCTPELVHFCARLPPEWRRFRRIERLLLARHGLSEQVTSPRVRDDFSPAMSRSMRGPARTLLTRLFRSSALADLGIVDGGKLRADYAAWCDGGRDVGATVFYATAILELSLQRGARR
ncbi:asparagine synthase C-terminal domain-containing protein [uncultured Sphingomonas sp.]|uniref:asparagine synthase-related protein n=1 Tax=uncultured Sphingomonas sp. TaxID=158754 RepID=UPI0025D055DE|nr:asparagine synthase C-terminal domain-containing protein [uncultured Sphingomonas sp.]